MTSRIYLSDSDSDLSHAVSLVMDSSLSSRITVQLDGFKAPPPDPVKAETDPNYRRTVTLALLIKGATVVQLDELRRSILAYQTLARRATGAPGGYWTGTPVVLWVALRDSPNYVYFDVTNLALAEHSRFRGPDNAQFWTLSLECLPYARGAQQTLPASPTSIANGTSCYAWVPGVPGDCDALAQVVYVDQSDNTEYVNALRVFRRGLKWMGSGDFAPFIAAAALSPGSQVSDAAGLDGVHMQSLTCTGAWQSCATITVPAGGLNDPYAHVFVQAKTPTAVIHTPGGLSGSISTVGGSLTGNRTYSVAVSAIDGSGNETAACTPVSFTTPNVTNTNLIVLTWADSGGTPTDHAVYSMLGPAGTWHRQLTSSSSSGFTFAADSGTSTNPPASSASALIPPQLRASVAINTASPEYGPPGDPVPLVLGSSAEWVYAGLFPLPPLARQEGYASLGAIIKIEGQSISGATQTLKVGGAAIVPASEPSLYAERSGLSDTTLRRWQLDTRRDLRTSGIVTGTSGPPYTTQGQVVPRGTFTLAPGGNIVGVQLYGASGEANAGHLKGTVQFVVTPRYIDVAAVPS